MSRTRSSLVATFAIASALCACSDEAAEADIEAADTDVSIDAGPTALTETEVRAALSIPKEAERVLFLSQSSHIDPGWQKTMEQYYNEFVEGIFLEAEVWLDAEPDAHYSIAEMSFLRRHFEDHDSAGFRDHAADGRLRIVGGGVSSPDTLLPTDEAIIRDYLLGTIWAEEELGVRPRTAWLPDSFGHTPTFPDLLQGMGYTAVGFGRTDGARGPYEVDYLGFERIMEGSSTAATLRDLGSADFFWVGPGGGEVLAHYMPFDLYFLGDSIDFDGLAIPGTRLGNEFEDDATYTDGRISEYIELLTPFSRTPYLFVPVGGDFQPPRPRLVEYAQRWNDEHYESSDVWVTVATFEDYMDLVRFHGEALPRLEADMTPYWTGFYGSRPGLKAHIRSAGELLTGLEPFLALAEQAELLDGDVDLFELWWVVALSNHHDFIPGTSTNHVVDEEQAPWLDEVIDEANGAWSDVSQALAGSIDTSNTADGEPVVVFNPGPYDRSAVVEVESAADGDQVRVAAGDDLYTAQPTNGGRVAFVAGDVPAFGWRVFSLQEGRQTGVTAAVEGDTATIDTGALVVRFHRSEEAIASGWYLASLQAGDDDELLDGDSLEWIRYDDTGGLWRIGSEMDGCDFAVAAVLRPDTLEVIESGPARALVRLTFADEVEPLAMDVIAHAGGDQLYIVATGSTPRESTTTLRIRPRGTDDRLQMGVVGGVADRALEKRFDPTYWPAVTWVAQGSTVVHLWAATGVHGSDDGALEWMVLRNANSEIPCDMLGGIGHDDDVHTLNFSIGALGDSLDPARETGRSIAMTRPMIAVPTDRHAGQLPDTGRLLTVEGDGVVPTAIKPADRGDGIVVHLLRPTAEEAEVTIRHGLLWSGTATRPNLLEEGDVPFGASVDDGVTGTLDRPVTAIRLVE